MSTVPERAYVKGLKKEKKRKKNLQVEMLF